MLSIIEAILPLPYIKQEQQNWCWAAVVQNLAILYQGSYSDAQKDIVRANWHGSRLGMLQDAPTLLERPLQKARIMVRKLGCPISFEQIQQEIDCERAIAVRIRWPEGGGHFLIIHGYELRDGNERIHIFDPARGSFVNPYADPAAHYEKAWAWTHTYFTSGNFPL